MDSFLRDLVNRLFERETLVVIAAFYLVYAGKIENVEQAAAIISTVVALIGGRSWAKAAAAGVQPPRVEVPPTFTITTGTTSGPPA